MNLHERITADVTLAAKSGDDARRDTLRFLLAALHNREIEKRSGEESKNPLTDADVMAVVGREVKKRNEAIAFFEKGNRPEQAAKEKTELAILESYLPAALPEAEVEKLVEEAIRTVAASLPTGQAGVKDIGKVMGAVMKAAKGARVDASAVGAKVKARLAG